MLFTSVYVLIAILCTVVIHRVLRQRSFRWLRGHEAAVSGVQMPSTAGALVQRYIDAAGLRAFVRAGKRGDKKGHDFYDSDDATVNLTTRTANSDRLGDGFIAAHEVGHAVVDHHSRMAKLICDTSAYVQMPVVTKVLFAAAVVLAFLGPSLLPLILAALLVQVLAASIIMLVEARATHYGLLIIAGTLEVPENILRALRKCGHGALFTHSHEVLWPAVLLLVFSALTDYNRSPLLLVPAGAVVAYTVLLAVCGLSRTAAR